MKKFIAEVIKSWSNDNASMLAAALSFYTFFSITPLIIVIVNITGSLFGEQLVQENIMSQISGLIGEQGARIISDFMARKQSQPSSGLISSILGTLMLVAGAVAVFMQLQLALNIIWQAPQTAAKGIWGFIRKYILSFGIVVSTGFILLVSLVVSSLLSALGRCCSNFLPAAGMLLKAADFTASFVVIALLFALIFKLLPNIKIKWHDVWVGAGVTSLLFGFGKFIIGLYIGNSNIGGTYGAAASIVVILLWIYYSSQILLLGVEFTKEYTKTYGTGVVAIKPP